jgi:O-succinylbenzoic acid--CoA ligase
MKTDSLTIHNHAYDQQTLTELCHSKIRRDETPSWEKEVYGFILQWMDDSDTIIQYSSGTTGKSKMIRLPKLAMVRSAESTCQFFKLMHGQTAALCLPMEYIAGKMMVVRSIVCGLNLYITEPKSKPEFAGMDKIDFCAMVPFQVANTWPAGIGMPPVRILIIGGAEIPKETENLLKDIPAEVYATYGMAETCSHIALRKINGLNPDNLYQALPGVKLETDKRGCLVIKAPYLPGPVITNDQVQLEGNGRFRWIGRLDNLINSGGIKVVPEELELKLAAETGVEGALIGLPDPVLGQRLVLVIEKDQHPVPEETIRKELARLLPARLMPKQIITIEKFPRNNSFKIDRLKLARSVYEMP